MVPAAEGPVLEPPPDAPPGTVLLAITPDATIGWVTAVVLDEDGPALLRDGGPVVLGIAGGLSRQGETWSATGGTR